MVKSHTQKKHTSKKKAVLPPIMVNAIDQATEKIKQWTRHELARLHQDRNTSCIPIRNGYKIGLYTLEIFPNKTCIVRDHNNESLHTFDTKLSAILYTIYRIKCQFTVSEQILLLDREINKNYVDTQTLTHGIDSARKLRDYVKVDAGLARLELSQKRLDLARDKISKIHRLAKYTKIWE